MKRYLSQFFRNLSFFFKMSFLIDSYDYTGTSAYNGSYSLNKSISGPYKVRYQYFGTTVFNAVYWCNSTNNNLYVIPYWTNGSMSNVNITFRDIASNDSNDIVTWLQNGFDQLTALGGGWIAVNPVVSYDNSDDTYHIVFEREIAFGPFLPAETDNALELSQASSIAKLFGWSPDGGGLNENPTYELMLSGANFGTDANEILEIYSPQMKSTLITSNTGNERKQSLLLNTGTLQIPDQYIFIDQTDTLELYIYKPGGTIPVNLDNHFLLYFHQIPRST